MNRSGFKLFAIAGIILVCAIFVSAYAGADEKGTELPEIFPSNILEITETFYFEELKGILYVFETVFFDQYPLSFFTEVLKKEGGLKGVGKVLDIGTGNGVLGFAAIAYGAESVVGTDLDSIAIANAEYNIKELGLSEKFETRKVQADDPGAYSVVKPGEKFDLIISLPPQGDDDIAEAKGDMKWPYKKSKFYSVDKDFVLLESIVGGIEDHLTPGGRAIIILKTKIYKDKLQQLVEKNGLEMKELYSVGKDAKLFDKEIIRARHQWTLRRWVFYELKPGK